MGGATYGLHIYIHLIFNIRGGAATSYLNVSDFLFQRASVILAVQKRSIMLLDKSNMYLLLQMYLVTYKWEQ